MVFDWVFNYCDIAQKIENNPEIKERKEAITATAHNLAVIYFNMITKQQPFEYTRSHTDNEKYRQNAIRKLKKSIKELNLIPQDLDLAA